MKIASKFLFLIAFCHMSHLSLANGDDETKNVTVTRPTTTTTTEASPVNAISGAFESIRKFFFGPFTTPRPPPSSKVQIPISRTYSNLYINKSEPLKVEESAESRSLSRPDDDELKCPTEREARFELFPVTCNKNQDCFNSLGKKFRCCKLFGGQRCHEGLEVPLEDIEHEPLFGIPRKCPKEPLAESFWDVKNCEKDADCDWARICCPIGRKRYCMNSYTPPEELPVGRQLAYPVESISQYFQCSPPPPPAFDPHPKECNSSITCFPNICCLENGGKKYCRPPKRNLLAALTTFGQRFNVGLIRDWTSNLVIP